MYRNISIPILVCIRERKAGRIAEVAAFFLFLVQKPSSLFRKLVNLLSGDSISIGDDLTLVFNFYQILEFCKFHIKLYFEFKPSNLSSYQKPHIKYRVIELFAGSGGLALGLEKAGLSCLVLNEVDKDACQTLRQNRPNWNVIERDIRQVDFSAYKSKAEIVTGGFPCQSFSCAGKKLGVQDARGALFYEFLRAVKEIQPIICLGENVRGLLKHESGKTLGDMLSALECIGYNVLPPCVLKAIFYRVPQKRERLFIIGIRKDINIEYEFPKTCNDLYTLKDALKAGRLFDSDVPKSVGMSYTKRKREILEHVPQGGCWRDLPVDLQKEYMQKSFYMSGGKTGVARRISWSEPCLTLTCSPAQKQTERCHPDETRPFTVGEYARIQTFPDSWKFYGSLSSQYRQIGNAVPVNLAQEIGYTLIKALNSYKEVGLK